MKTALDQFRSPCDVVTPAEFRQHQEKSVSVVNRILARLDDVTLAQVYPPSVELFTQGVKGQDVYFVERGMVKLLRAEADGRHLIVDLRFPGYFIGAAAVIAGKAQAVTAITLTKSCLRRVHASVFSRLLQTDMQFSWDMHYVNSCEAFDSIARITQLGFISARHRFEQLIWQLLSVQEVNAMHEECRLEMPLKYWEVAELLAVAPAYLSRLIKKLERERVLSRKNGWLIIHHPQKLWHWMES